MIFSGPCQVPCYCVILWPFQPCSAETPSVLRLSQGAAGRAAADTRDLQAAWFDPPEKIHPARLQAGGSPKGGQSANLVVFGVPHKKGPLQKFDGFWVPCSSFGLVAAKGLRGVAGCSMAEVLVRDAAFDRRNPREFGVAKSSFDQPLFWPMNKRKGRFGFPTVLEWVCQGFPMF